jgi:hypothetical protein
MQLKTLFRSPGRDEDLADAQQATYANWREASDGVAEAYRSWAAVPRGERFLAQAAYLAALERKERAAGAYQELVEQFRAAAAGDRTD